MNNTKSGHNLKNKYQLVELHTIIRFLTIITRYTVGISGVKVANHVYYFCLFFPVSTTQW